MELSIVLVNYNGLKYLSRCLDSIRRFAPFDSEVILVDNGSSDSSPDMVEREYPWVKLLRSGQNLGFTGGNNLAATQASGDVLLLLNADTLLLEPLAPALKWLRENPDFGIVSIGMVDGSGVLQASIGRFPSPARLAFLRRMLVVPNHYKDDKAYQVDWVQGSFLLIKRSIWQKLGGLDSRYFMYVEDVDLCRRCQQLNYKCGFLPQTRYMHFGGFSTARFPRQISNLALYVELHMKGPNKIASMLVLILGCVARVLWFSLRNLIAHDEQSRITQRACWEALRALTVVNSRVSAAEFEARP